MKLVLVVQIKQAAHILLMILSLYKGENNGKMGITIIFGGRGPVLRG
jgi:hypothetical protein